MKLGYSFISNLLECIKIYVEKVPITIELHFVNSVKQLVHLWMLYTVQNNMKVMQVTFM